MMTSCNKPAEQPLRSKESCKIDMSTREACAAVKTEDAAKLIDTRDEPRSQISISLSEVCTLNDDQLEGQRNHSDTAREFVFIDQTSHLMLHSNEALDDDPLSTVGNCTGKQSIENSCALAKENLHSVEHTQSQQKNYDSGRHSELHNENPFFLTDTPSTSKQKQCFKSIFNDETVLEPSESSSLDGSCNILEEDPLSLQHVSSQCVRRLYVALDPLEQSSVLRTLLLSSKSTSKWGNSVDIVVADDSSPEHSAHSSEQKQFFERTFMNRISLERTVPKNTLLEQVLKPSQLPSIVSLIKVKKTLLQRRESIEKIRLPKKAVLKKNSSKQQTELGSKNQTLSELASLTHNSIKKLSWKERTSKKIRKPKNGPKKQMSKQPTPAVDQIKTVPEKTALEQNLLKKVLPKKAVQKIVPKIKQVPKKAFLCTPSKQHTLENCPIDNMLEQTTLGQNSLTDSQKEDEPKNIPNPKKTSKKVSKKKSPSKNPTSSTGSKVQTLAKTSETKKARKPNVSLSKSAKPKEQSQACDADKPAPTIPCSECDKLFNSYRSRARHFRCHKVPLVYTCDWCPKTFKNRSSVMSHSNVHSEIKRYTCSLCPEKFAWRNTWRTHELNHQARINDPFRCRVCDKKFWYQQTWDEHVTKGGCVKRDPHAPVRTYQCDICQRVLTTRGNLSKHLAMHQGLRPYVCETCDCRFTAQSSLNDHMRIHDGLRPFVCDVCGKSFVQSSGFRQHMAIHGECQFVCDVCHKGFKLSRYLVKHMETMHADDNKYNCHHCGKLFKLGDYLRRHIKAVHSGEKKSGAKRHHKRKQQTREPQTEKPCDGVDGASADYVMLDFEAGVEGDCEIGMDEDSLLSEIEKNTLGNSVVGEACCGATAEIDSVRTEKENDENVIFVFGDLAGESVTETAEVAIEESCAWDHRKFGGSASIGFDGGVTEMCEITIGDGAEARVKPKGRCLGVAVNEIADFGISVVRSSDCSGDKVLKHAAGLAEASSSEDVPAPNRASCRPFQCLVCLKAFRKQTSLASHMGCHSLDRPLECDVCRHRFATKQVIRRHIQSHGVNNADELRCPPCGKLYVRLVDRLRHVCPAAEQRAYRCAKCDAAFERRRLLLRHVRERHEASLQCGVCDKIFTTSWNLKKHRVVHTGDKRFVCEVCGARFTANQSLKMHALLHAGQQLHVCSFCAKAFTQRSSLKQHEMLHDREPRYACEFCDKRFKVVSYLRRHIAVLHTDEKPFVCGVCGKRYGLRSGLRIHERTHRERRRFECRDCDKTFSDARYMRKHVKKEHAFEGGPDSG